MNNVMDRTVETLSETFRRITPLTAPAVYSRHFGAKHENEMTVVATDGALMKMELLSTLEDKKTGFRGDVMIDRASGHAIILYKGMDVPLKDEGNGRTGFLRDAFTAAQTWFTGGHNVQTPFAEKLFLDTRNNPDVRSIETIGFSLGTLHANYMSAKYGIHATVLADLGIADKGLKAIFNDASQDRLATVHKDMQKNVTVLRMGLDLIPLFGPGPHRGRVVDIDQGSVPDASGLAHLASVYSKKSERLMNTNVAATLAVPGVS